MTIKHFKSHTKKHHHHNKLNKMKNHMEHHIEYPMGNLMKHPKHQHNIQYITSRPKLQQHDMIDQHKYKDITIPYSLHCIYYGFRYPLIV